ncbi:MAG: UPF0182 family protein [Balneolaceae bacterium]
MTTRTIFRLVLFVLLPFLLISLTSSWILEYLWLNELGYTQVFWTLRITQIALIAGAFALAAGYLVPNLRHLAKQLKHVNFTGSPLQGLDVNLGGALDNKKLRFFFTIAALVISLLFAFGFTLRWDESLRFLWNVSFGESDPLFGRDIGFYMFQLPFWQLIQSSIVILTFIATLILAVVYLFTGLLGMQPGSGVQASAAVRNHLALNAGLWMLAISWGYYLDRFGLLFATDGIVYGATYTDVTVLLPVYWIMLALTALLGVLLLIQFKIKTGKAIPMVGILGLIVLIGGQGILPSFVQNFSVNPNELELETPYLENNIEMTRLAYNLNTVREIEYQADDTLTLADIRNNQDAVNNIRLWDPRLLIQTYKQLQEIRSYYEFYSVDNDRYMVNGEVTQMMLSAREIARRLPSQSDTWVNRHLQFTHGYGLTMSPVTEANRQGEPLLTIRDIPPIYESPNLQITNPAIYYGENSSGYYFVNTGVQELHFPQGDDNVYINYDGIGGIQVSNFFRRALFAWEKGDINILLSSLIHNESRFQLWRSVQERVRKITPFLELDRDPYLVLFDGRLFWIQDAYTTSSHFPYSRRTGGINYIRNSVKIVVDAYNGSVDYYMVDENDPVLQVYDSIFPGLFQPLSELPNGLDRHFRYPQDLFEIQIDVFNRYHMVRPQVFYNQEDLWTRPNEKYGGRQILMEPYYVLARLPGEEELEFMLISPLTPENRDNMIAWMTAKSDPGSYGELIAFKLPKDRLIYGPAQIEARIDQDPEISQQIALWDQRGSRVIRGNLMVIPIENSFLYVEPVFLLADGVDIPQLQRVIVAIGDNISMQPTLDMAIAELFGDELLAAERPIRQLPRASEAGQPQPGDAISPEALADSRQLQEFRRLWNNLRTALESGDWARYGEILQEMDDLLN